jgi:hypothetical protein
MFYYYRYNRHVKHIENNKDKFEIICFKLLFTSQSNDYILIIAYK